MSITITNRKGRQTIRATGKDAQALFDAMCELVEAHDAEKPAQNGRNAVPNRPKSQTGTGGAQAPDNASSAP